MSTKSKKSKKPAAPPSPSSSESEEETEFQQDEDEEDEVTLEQEETEAIEEEDPDLQPEPNVNEGDGDGDNEEEEEAEEKVISFSDLGLDPRIVKSIHVLGWKEPTLIQEKVIPLALDKKKDILGRGRTGCGKTAAFLIPILQSILRMKESKGNPEVGATGLILAPSQALCNQITKVANDLNRFTSNVISILDISIKSPDLPHLMSTKPDIIVSTPSRLLDSFQGSSSDTVSADSLKISLKFLVIDEADLMFSFGYEDNLKTIIDSVLPKTGAQTFMMSATLTKNVSALKKLALRNPVTLKLEEPDLPDSGRLIQYHVQCDAEEKYTVLLSLFKLKLIRGRTIVFTNTVDQCYRLRLFLQQFGIRSCILNPELPVSSRCHVVDQFNCGKYDIIIASDDKVTMNPKSKSTDPEYGVARGIDFQFVSNVINFDFPQSVTTYIHRVGRTGRGAETAEGTALSFVTIHDQRKFSSVQKSLGSGADFKPYAFKMEELEPFRYRTKDALRAVTSVSIREARLKEIKREMISSEKLKSFFSQRPKDLKVLSSDRDLGAINTPMHLRDMPDYMIPNTLKGLVKARGGRKRNNVTLSVVGPDIKKKKRSGRGGKGGGGGRSGKDPLKTFSIGKKRK